MNVRFVKLRTGDELFTELELDDNSGQYILTNPTKLGMSEQGVGLLEYPIFTPYPTVLHIDMDDVVFTCPIAQQLEDGYKNKFGKIVSPPTNLIVP